MEKKLKNKILIVGIGNLLYRDDGIGARVIEEMKKMALSDDLELLDMGTSTMDLIYHLDGVRKLIVIDAMKAGGAPGTIYRSRPEDLLPNEGKPVSLHDIGLIETLHLAGQRGRKMETVVIGVEPKILDWGMELSHELKERIPAIIEAVLKEC